MYVTGQHKNKQISDRLEYITHLHQHTWSIHNSYVSKMCIQNIANIFAGFWIRACWKTAKSAKINVPRIFPRLQYSLHVSWHPCKISQRSAPSGPRSEGGVKLTPPPPSKNLLSKSPVKIGLKIHILYKWICRTETNISSLITDFIALSYISNCGLSRSNGQAHNLKMWTVCLGHTWDHKLCLLARWTYSIRIQQDAA